MAVTKSTRKRMEDLIYSTFDALDPSKTNSNKYRAIFKSMSDQKFDSFFKSFFADEDQYLILDVADYDRDLRIEDVERAAKQLKVPLFEKVAMPFVNKDTKNPIVTKFEVPVGRKNIFTLLTLNPFNCWELLRA